MNFVGKLVTYKPRHEMSWEDAEDFEVYFSSHLNSKRWEEILNLLAHPCLVTRENKRSKESEIIYVTLFTKNGEFLTFPKSCVKICDSLTIYPVIFVGAK